MASPLMLLIQNRTVMNANDAAYWTAIGTVALAFITFLAIIVTLYNTHLIQKQANIMNEQLKDSKRRDQLQAITQLRGRREEIEDMYMSNVQAMLECQRLKIILKKIMAAKIETPTLFADEQKVIEDEYYRKRDFSDKMIIEVTKSSEHLFESISLIQYLFVDKKEKVNEIIKNHHKLKDKLTETSLVLGKDLDKLEFLNKYQYDLLANPKTDEIEQEIYKWIVDNIIKKLNELLEEIEFENIKK